MSQGGNNGSSYGPPSTPGTGSYGGSPSASGKPSGPTSQSQSYGQSQMQPYGQSQMQPYGQSQMQPYGQSQSNMGMGLGGLGNAYAPRQQMSQWNQPQQWQPQSQQQMPQMSDMMMRLPPMQAQQPQTGGQSLQQPFGEQNGLARRDMTQIQNPAMQTDAEPPTGAGQSVSAQQGQVNPPQTAFQNYQSAMPQNAWMNQAQQNAQSQGSPSGFMGAMPGGYRQQQMNQPFGGQNGQYQPSASGKPGAPMGGQQSQFDQYAQQAPMQSQLEQMPGSSNDRMRQYQPLVSLPQRNVGFD